MAARSAEPGSSVSTGVAWLLLVGSVAYSPTLLYLTWHEQLARGYRIGVYVLAVVVALGMVSSLISTLGPRLPGVLAALAVSWLIVADGTRIAAVFNVSGVGGATGVCLVAVGAGWATYRLQHLPPLRGVLVVMAVVLAGTPLLKLVGLGIDGGGGSAIQVQRETADVRSNQLSTGSEPDIWLVILDGFPSVAGAQGLYADAPRLADDLVARGFVANPDALAPYSVTGYSVPALLEMSYPFSSATETADITIASRAVKGNNQFVARLQQGGYHVTLVENGWHLSGCAPIIDHCVAAPWLDETMSILLSRSIFGAFFGVSRSSSFARGVGALREWTDTNLEAVSANGIADLVILHVLAPHPPLWLEEGCEASSGDLDDELAVWLPYFGIDVLEERRTAFQSQVGCVSSEVLRFVDRLDSGEIVAIVGDHGPDSQGQLAKTVESWTPGMVKERMLTLAAVRLPAGCDSELTSTLGTTRGIVSCVDGVTLPAIETRSFLTQEPQVSGAIRELDSKEVASLRE